MIDSSKNMVLNEKGRRITDKTDFGLNLIEAVKVNLLPTPMAADNYTGNLKSSQQKPGSKHSVTLPQAVRLLPTPTSSDYKGGALRKDTKKQMSNLKEHVYIFSEEQTKSIYLNPQFLEEMMGFETGWTELPL